MSEDDGRVFYRRDPLRAFRDKRGVWTLVTPAGDYLEVRNPAGRCLWNVLSRGATLNEMVIRLAKRYPTVPQGRLRTDILEFLNQLRSRSLIGSRRSPDRGGGKEGPGETGRMNPGLESTSGKPDPLSWGRLSPGCGAGHLAGQNAGPLAPDASVSRLFGLVGFAAPFPALVEIFVVRSRRFESGHRLVHRFSGTFFGWLSFLWPVAAARSGNVG